MTHHISNQVTLIGNLGKDAVAFDRGDVVGAEFRMATNYSVKSGDERKQRTDWHKCVLYGPRGQAVLERLKRGARVAVSGTLRNEEYDTSKDGTPVLVRGYSVVLSDIEFLSALPTQG